MKKYYIHTKSKEDVQKELDQLYIRFMEISNENRKLKAQNRMCFWLGVSILIGLFILWGIFERISNHIIMEEKMDQLIEAVERHAKENSQRLDKLEELLKSKTL